MRAQNLTISIPSKGCDKDCPYCVSKMTGFMEADESQFYYNLSKVKTVAKAAQVSSILVTAKGEPFLNLKACDLIGEKFSDFPLEIQTNGIRMLEEWKESGKILGSKYFDIIAFSIDSLSQWEEMSEMMFYIADNCNIIVRVTLNMTDRLPKDFEFMDAYKYALKSGVRQLSFRNIVIPENPVEGSEKIVNWINEHRCEEYYSRMIDSFNGVKDIASVVRKLIFGPVVYDFVGMAVTMFDECLQNSNNNEDIRSLIYQEDGHLYDSWNSSASVLF